MTDVQDVERANEEAQRRFRAALDDAIAKGSWNPVLVDAYLNAEENVRWEVSKAQFDELQAGDHYVYPSGVGR